MVPLRLVLNNALQQKEAHQSECHRKPPKMKTRGKIHSQPVQRSEHPNLSGNGSTQAVRLQSSGGRKKPQRSHRVNCQKRRQKMTRSEIHSQWRQRCEHPNLSGNRPSQSQIPQLPSPRKTKAIMCQNWNDWKWVNGSQARQEGFLTAHRLFQWKYIPRHSDHKDFRQDSNEVSFSQLIPPNGNQSSLIHCIRQFGIGTVNFFKKRKENGWDQTTPQKTAQKITRGINSQSDQLWEHSNLSGNGSTQAGIYQYPTAKESQSKCCIKPPQSMTSEQNSLTDSSTMSASQSQWEWFQLFWSNPLQQKKQTG